MGADMKNERITITLDLLFDESELEVLDEITKGVNKKHPGNNYDRTDILQNALKFGLAEYEKLYFSKS